MKKGRGEKEQTSIAGESLVPKLGHQ